jgi:PhnB protein
MEPAITPKLAPYLVVRNAAGLAQFIEKGIGGTAGFQEVDKDGTISHMEFRIADSVVMLADAPKNRPPFPAMIHLYVEDADAAFGRALKAGATSVREPTDAGDGRRGGVRDAWGNEWWFTRPSKASA